jgi:hypothetical protein
MRWIAAVFVAVALALALFTASPFVALYRLAAAVEARDVATIAARVDAPELRAHLVRQIATEYLKTARRSRELNGLDRQIVGLGASIADPIAEQLVTPAALIDLFDDGWPQAIAAPGGTPPIPLRLDLRSFGRIWRLFVTSESRGFRKIYIMLPHSRPPAERFRLQMRLRDGTWHLATVDLPQTLLRNLVGKLPRAPGDREG